MNDVSFPRPERLLLATDLSPRCDRALDRAAQLATEWNAELLALHVLEAPEPPDLVLQWASGKDDESLRLYAGRQLEQDLESVRVRSRMRIAHGDAAAAIEQSVQQDNCGLVITGVARSEAMGRFLLGGTVDRLARTLSQPLLVVRNRVHGAYRKLVVASDFSSASGYALRAALDLFPEGAVTVLHASKLPMEELADKSVGRETAQRRVEQEWDAFLQRCEVSVAERKRLDLVVEPGALESALARHVRTRGSELVVIGSEGGSRLRDMLLGSSTARVLEWALCDTLVVRAPDS